MEQPRVNNENHSLIIDIPDGGNVSTSGSSSENDLTQHGNAAVQNDQPSSGVQSSSSSSNRSNSRPGPSFYKVLVSVKLTFKMSLILSSIIALIMSRHEKPRNPLFAWIVGYTVGCAVSIPIIFRHYFISRPSLCRLVDRFRWLLEFFSALWFVLGNYWIFGGKSYSDAHIMYRFGVVFLVFDYIKYIGPTILCAIVLCCYRGLLQTNGAAPTESINALPTYKFKLQGDGDNGGRESAEKRQVGGILAAGTEKERALSGEDAVCCICLADYTDNDVLKELPCTHLFHATCVDLWLKIKAFCPLCKCMIEKSAGSGETQAATDTNQQV